MKELISYNYAKVAPGYRGWQINYCKSVNYNPIPSMKEKHRYLAPTCEEVAFATQGIIATSIASVEVTMDNPFSDIPDVFDWTNI